MVERPNPEKLSILKELARELAREDDEPSEARLLIRLASRLVAPSDRNRAELDALLNEERLRHSLRKTMNEDEEADWLDEHGSDDLEDQLDELLEEGDE